MRIINDLLDINREWGKAVGSERPALVVKAASKVNELVDRGQTFSPNPSELPRQILNAFRPFCNLAPSDVKHTLPTFVKGYVVKSKGDVVVRDTENDIPDYWGEVFKSILPDEFAVDIAASGNPMYDLVMARPFDLNLYDFAKAGSCYACDKDATLQYSVYSDSSGLTQGMSCKPHFDSLKRTGVRVIAKRRRPYRNSSTWIAKDAMTTGDFTGDDKGGTLTVTQAPKKKREIAPFFKAEDDGFIVWAKVPDVVVEKLSKFMDDDIEPHITIAYLDPADDVMSYDKNRTLEIVSGMVNRSEELEARIGGFAQFHTMDGKRPIVALIDSKPLADFRAVLSKRLDNTGIPFHNEYSYTPHVTLSYEDTALPELDEDITFNITDIEVVNASEVRSLTIGEGSDEIEPFLKFTEDINEGDHRVGILKMGEEEERYTYTVVYKPDVADAHNEYITAKELQRALWNHVRAGDRSVYIQHGRVSGIGFEKAGEWVELNHWPYEVEAEFQFVDGKSETRTIPAGSIWMGTIWEPWAWDLIKSGTIRGLSFGGTSRRALPDVLQAE